MKKILIAAVLATAAASPSFAATVHHRHMAPAQPVSADAYAMARATTLVVQDGQVLGADPDPFIRGELAREGNPANLSQ